MSMTSRPACSSHPPTSAVAETRFAGNGAAASKYNSSAAATTNVGSPGCEAALDRIIATVY
jgi:hypothetical protein